MCLILSAFYPLLSVCSLYSPPCTDPHTALQIKKKLGPFLSAPLSSWLGLCYRAALYPELSQCLKALSERPLSFFPASIQDQPGHVHFLPSVQHRPRFHPLEKLCLSIPPLFSTICPDLILGISQITGTSN